VKREERRRCPPTPVYGNRRIIEKEKEEDKSDFSYITKSTL
jgi:hypothetical protein